MPRKLRDQGPCVFCGKPATTRDHIPPKGLFAEPRPNNLITVPACGTCNQGTSEDDEFLQRLSWFNGSECSQDANQVSQKVRRAIDKPNRKRMRAGLLQTLTPVELLTPSGLSAGIGFKLRMDGDRMSSIIRKIIKGMFWKVRNERLPIGYMVDVQLVGTAPPHESLRENERQILAFEERIIGDQAFAYRHVFCEEDPFISAWRFEFYRAVSYMGYTFLQGKTQSTILSIKDALLGAR
jgi:hypothetical protein